MSEQLAECLRKLPDLLGGHMLLSLASLAVGLIASLPLGILTSRWPRMWPTQSRLCSIPVQAWLSPPWEGSSPTSPAVMVNNSRMVTRRSRGSALAGRWAPRSSPTVWSRLRRYRSARAMPTSAEVMLLVTDQVLWPSLAVNPCQ